MCADGFEDFVPALERLLTATAEADIGGVSDEVTAAEKSFAASGATRCSNGSDSTPPEGRAPILATTLNSSAAGCGRGEWSRACSATSSKSPNPSG